MCYYMCCSFASAVVILLLHCNDANKKKIIAQLRIYVERVYTHIHDEGK